MNVGLGHESKIGSLDVLSVVSLRMVAHSRWHGYAAMGKGRSTGRGSSIDRRDAMGTVRNNGNKYIFLWCIKG
jgi:hypothetical protein